MTTIPLTSMVTVIIIRTFLFREDNLYMKWSNRATKVYPRTNVLCTFRSIKLPKERLNDYGWFSLSKLSFYSNLQHSYYFLL